MEGYEKKGRGGEGSRGDGKGEDGRKGVRRWPKEEKEKWRICK